MAESKAHLDTAKETAASGMGDFLRKQGEHVAKLDQFVGAHVEFFQRSLERLQRLQLQMKEKQADPASSQELDQVLLGAVAPVEGGDESGRRTASAAAPAAAKPRAGPPPGRKPKAEGKVVKALYDFAAENEGELTFKADDRITNVTEIDANWLEGTVDGKRGMFPTTYVA